MSAGRQFAAIGGVGALIVAGAVGGRRWRVQEVRRAELNKEYEKIVGETRAFDEDTLQRASELDKKEKMTAQMLETVDVLWDDRLERYRQTNLDLHAYLLALPESLGALKGLTNHYRYMSEEMGKFVTFDIACSKLHNLSLLLQHGRAVGFSRVADTVRDMFAAEPLVAAVCDNVRQLDGVAHPRSVADASASFSFCLEELDAAVEAVAVRFEDALVAPSPVRAPSAVSDGVREVLRRGRLDAFTKGQRELAVKRAALEKVLARERRQLHTEEDVRAALDYVAQLQAHFGTPQKRGLFSKEDKFLAAVQGDALVKRAVQQAMLWRSSAAVFLMQSQAESALDCYQKLLAETLTKVNDLPQ